MSQEAGTIHVEHVDDVVVINVSGDFSHQPPGSIEETVTEVLNDGARRIVIDLSQTTRFDSAAIGDLVQAYTEAARREAAFVVVFKPPDPNLIIEPLRLFDVYYSREEALEALQEPTGDKRSRSGGKWLNWLLRQGR
jgi:anti-anti-sigma factor